MAATGQAPTVTRGYVDGPWGQVHYRRCGTGDAALLFFHESPLSSRTYEAVLPLLGSEFTAIAFDTPGYGLSDPPPEEGKEIPDYAAVLLAAADALGVRRFVPCGVHTGASLALEVAHRAGPDRAVAAVLSGVPLLTEEERAKFLAEWAPPIDIDGEGSQYAWATARYRRIWGAETAPELLHLAVHDLTLNWSRYNWAYNAAFRHDPGPTLKAWPRPVLFLDAEHDLLVEHDRRAGEVVRESSMVIVGGLPGQLPLRVPERYAAEVAAFCTPHLRRTRQYRPIPSHDEENGHDHGLRR